MSLLCIVLSSSGGKDITLGNFVKFGGGGVVHYGCFMSKIFLFVAIMNNLLKGVHLPCFNSSHDLPICVCTIQDAIGYVVMWSWKQIATCLYIDTNC
jgi:hypothetical protein